MASTSRHAAKAGFLPPEARRFLRRRCGEVIGGVFGIAALALLFALASYDPSDPSLNTAAAAPPSNLVGSLGATVADWLMQYFGLAAWLPVLVLAAWGWRLGARHGLAHPALRVAALPIVLTCAATALAVIPSPGGWPLRAGTGGVVGDVLLHQLAAVAPTHGAAVVLMVGLGAAVLALAALIPLLGLARYEWRAIGNAMWWLGVRGTRGGMHSGRYGLEAGRWGWRRLRDVHAAARARRHGADTVPDDIDDDTDSEDNAGRVRREPHLNWRGAAAEPDAPAAQRAADHSADKIVVERPRKATTPGRHAQTRGQAALDLMVEGEYQLPALDLLNEPPPAPSEAPNEDALAENARLLESVLEDFGVRGRIVKVRPGPVVTLYELEPAPGIKSSRVIGLADDIARSMSAVSVRCAVVPGRNVIGIELPNATRELVSLRELLASSAYERTAAQLTLVLGKDIGGSPVIVDLARMPHLLVAGTTGSGKSVAINTMICSLLFRLPPDKCKFIMIDPKMLELSVYDGIPHLLAPVVTDPGKAVTALRWVVREMETRYRNMSHLGVRNISGYNARLAEAAEAGEALMRTVQTGFDSDTGEPIYEDVPFDMTPLPLIVVIVDEMADLMLVAGKDVESAIQRLAQMARAAGIHLIMATQRPSVDVITGTIKANFPTRISFQVTSKIDSRTILGDGGAEQLLGQGDMLYMAAGGRITRVHGPLVTDEEVERVVSVLRRQGEPDYVEAVTEGENDSPFLPAASFGGAGDGGGSAEDELYDQAVALVCRERKASTSFVQRHLQIGYNRAARIIERMESEGVVSAANHVGKREVLARDIDDRTS